MKLAGKAVVVTGAGSGIGRALCVELARLGARVAACDIDRPAAEKTVSLLEGRSSDHGAFTLDVADESSFGALRSDLRAQFGSVDALVNNAGVLGRMSPLSELTTVELRRVVEIDLWGVIYGTRAFIDDLRSRPEALLVNVCSLSGLMGSLGNPGYCAAKFGVRGFSESTASELRKTSVRVVTVFPGVVRTSLGASHPGYSELERAEAIRKYNAQPGITPERAARVIVRGMASGKRRVLVGPDVWLLDKLIRLAPTATHAVLHRFTVRMINRQLPSGVSSFES